MMGRRHRGGRGQRTLINLRGLPRFGGWNPLKVVAVLAAVVIGGVVAAIIGAMLTMLLTILGLMTTGASFLLTYGWIIAAFLIYRAIRSRQQRRQETPHLAAEQWRQTETEREREYQRRLAEMQQCADGPQPRPREQQSNVGAGALAVLSGLVLAFGANAGLSGLNLSPLASTVLPPLTGALAGVGVYAALKRWIMPPIDEEKPSAKQVRAQTGRIRRKARDLRRESTSAGGVFNGLDVQADRLAAEAQELANRLLDLRRVARDVRADMGATRNVPDQRVHELLARNRSAQRHCLTQIERIEDLLDVARLEIACPEESLPVDRGREELVQEVETELEAARRALEEVQRQSQTV